jgi:CarD family transcriptional regulator
VVRDLHRADDQREQSYSERQLYEAALERLTREFAAVGNGNEIDAGTEITDTLQSRASAA